MDIGKCLYFWGEREYEQAYQIKLQKVHNNLPDLSIQFWLQEFDIRNVLMEPLINGDDPQDDGWVILRVDN